MSSIRKRREALERQEAKTSAAIKLLQIECQHPNATKKYGASTGNYDPSANGYWIDFQCPDCGKRWSVDQ